MLLQFKVSNFRSIREEQIFSLVASNYDKKTLYDQNLIDPKLAGLPKVRLLKGAAIYGANASGKSNVLAALNFMIGFVRKSTEKLGSGVSTGTEPFCLDAQSYNDVSSFEVIVVIAGVRYKYGFSLDRERIHREYLVAYPKGKAQAWFDRKYKPKTKDYTWKNSKSFFKLDKGLKDKTRVNSLFLSVGANWNNAQLALVCDWFGETIHGLNLEGRKPSPSLTASLIKEKKHEEVLNLLKSADLGITGVDVEYFTVEETSEKLKKLPPCIVERQRAEASLSDEELLKRIRVRHQGNGNVSPVIDFKKESAGTQRFFALIGPWLGFLCHGFVILIDELETSLHPLLVKELLKLMFSAECNAKGAQIIFTTHNPLLLDTEILRRDQIWFTEKDDHGVTHLYPLTDYNPRPEESLSRGYLAGRYGALPFIPEGLKMR